MDSPTDKQRILLLEERKQYEERARRLRNGECGTGYSSEDRQKMGDAYRQRTGCPEIDRKTVRAIQTLYANPPKMQHPVQYACMPNGPKERLLELEKENDTGSDSTSKHGELYYHVAKKIRIGARQKDVFSGMRETKDVEYGSSGTDSETTSEDEDKDYHLANKKSKYAHLKGVSDVCETKEVICDRQEA